MTLKKLRKSFDTACVNNRYTDNSTARNYDNCIVLMIVVEEVIKQMKSDDPLITPELKREGGKLLRHFIEIYDMPVDVIR